MRWLIWNSICWPSTSSECSHSRRQCPFLSKRLYKYLVPDRGVLFGAGTEYHRRQRSEQNLEVERQGPVIDIVEVQFDPVSKVTHLIAAANLPEAGQSRLHAESAALRSVL